MSAPNAPLYKSIPPVKQALPTDPVLPTAPETVNDSSNNFSARAAAAIYQAAGQTLTDPKFGSGYGTEDYGTAVLADFAYADYFDDASNATRFRNQAIDSLRNERPYKTGTGERPDGDYDFLLNLYIPLVYKYYNDLRDSVREYIINVLLSVRGPLTSHESEYIEIPIVGTYIPETENHLFLIETARYLTNQILCQRTHDPQYDNRRNGSGMDPPATAVWLLYSLQAVLQHDFAEYNARPYQDNIMMALLNLESYAYDYDVRLAARMALDYISAKVAVSSNDLRRAPPFRRLNKNEHWGPNIPGDFFLRSPLLIPHDYPDRPGEPFEPDVQGAWYAMLAGNTGLLPSNRAPGNFALEMVFAGVHDYRVPDLILDLFVSPRNRRFYQRLQHSHTDRDAGLSTIVDELYAGSPSYLITAGGHPTGYCYTAVIAGVPEGGRTADLGSAMPTTFMPTGSGLTLESMIQFGRYTDDITANDPVKSHMGVAPDFACGAGVFRTAEIKNADPKDRQGPWTFLNRGHSGEQIPGYYLALYDGSIFGDSVALLEAYDTWLHPVLSFDQFKSKVLGLHGSTRFSGSGTNTYVTQSGQIITFTISPVSEIVSSGFEGEFAYGSVINSAPGIWSDHDFKSGSAGENHA